LRAQVEIAIGMLEQLDLVRQPLAIAAAVGVLRTALEGQVAQLVVLSGEEVAYIEASNLAKTIYRVHFREGDEYWRVRPDLRGVISQISNMVSVMTRASAPGRDPVFSRADVAEKTGERNPQRENRLQQRILQTLGSQQAHSTDRKGIAAPGQAETHRCPEDDSEAKP
jgi:hypothetical protein